MCESCNNSNSNLIAAVANGHYYKQVCRNCLGGTDLSNGAASFDRRRGYEDYAQDTIQPYDAVGPSQEFYRLYPDAATKIFTGAQIEQLKRKI